VGKTVSTDFEIRADWEKLERGTPEDRACFAAIGLRYGNVWLTEAEDSFVHRVRGQVHLSAYRLAEWFAWNWWRLRWEPRTRAVDWVLAHHMTTIGGGYVWPNLTIFSDGERIVWLAKPTQPDAREPIRYIANIAAIVLPGSFESALDRFVEQVLGQLHEEGVQASNLAAVWENVRNERSDPQLAERRKLEALLGFDPDEADDAVLERLILDATTMGRGAVEEIAAESPLQGEVLTASKLGEVADAVGFESHPRDSVHLDSNTVLPRVGQSPAWLRGAAAARALRNQQNLGAAPLGSSRLAQMAAVTADVVESRDRLSIFSFALDRTPTRGRIVLRSKWATGRRFELARIIGDRLAGSTSDGQLHPATHSFTYRQKFQRAFAAELLCPFDALEHMLHGDYSAEAMQDAADYFEVSPLTVRTLLVNHKRLEREDLDEEGELVAAA
jgi:hypothetical protein